MKVTENCLKFMMTDFYYFFPICGCMCDFYVTNFNQTSIIIFPYYVIIIIHKIELRNEETAYLNILIKHTTKQNKH